MGKKVFKYFIIFLIVPIIISLIIALFSDKDKLKGPTKTYDSMSGTIEHYDYSYSDEIKSTNTFAYISVFTLVILGFGTWFYLKKKGDF